MSGSPVVSIVMTYYERLDQLRNTLRSFQIQGYRNCEVIIVDDGSVKQPLVKETFTGYGFNVSVITMPRERAHANPCVAFNIGFAQARGEIVVIQKAECLHSGDVLQHVSRNVKRDGCFSYASYGIEKDGTLRLASGRSPDWRLGDGLEMAR